MHRLVSGILVLLCWLLAAPVAHAEKRIALLIGNQAYSNDIGRLANPRNDVALLDQALKGLGFDVVTVRDAGLATLTTAVNAYARRVQAAGANAVAFFYYSGHGAADGGTNYLIPVDVKTTETGELWDQSLRLTEITRKLKAEAGNATHFVVFDACRNTLKLTKPGTRALVQSKGFVPTAQESGMLIAYATAEGELASDVGEGAGPYAKVLAEEIVKSGVEAVTMFRRVQVKVRSTIGQEPWLGFSALREVHLAGVEAPKPNQFAGAADVVRICREVEAMTSMSMLAVLERQHTGTPAADCISARIGELKAAQTVAAKAPEEQAKPEATAKKRAEDEAARASAEAERQRLSMLEQQRQEEARKAVEPKRSEAAMAPGSVFRDCPDCPEMVVVPAGSFMMGSPDNEEKHENDEGPMHKVTISKPFAVGKFEVTLDEWSACVRAGDCSYKANGVGKHPVSNVSWYDITKGFLPWLSRTAGRTYRLLTEAEWEYAARAGTTTSFSTGGMITPEQANFDGREVYGGSGKGVYRAKTVEVGTFRPNFFGLYDMHGNVSEWVEDCYRDSYSGAPSDGSAVIGDCASRVLRGGSFSGGPWVLRSAKRFASNPGIRSYNQGFRLARTLNP